MVDLTLFLPACFALNLAFGPNNLLSVNYGAQRGVWFSALAGTGRLLAFIPMILASALGLGALLSLSAVAFTILKIVGALYLIYLGVRLLMSGAKPGYSADEARLVTFKKAMRSEATVALSNPKAILIFAAFFPQFVNVQHYWSSYAILAALFLLLEGIAIVIYATIGSFARSFAAKKMHWFQRGSGIGMILFGGLLLLAKQPART